MNSARFIQVNDELCLHHPSQCQRRYFLLVSSIFGLLQVVHDSYANFHVQFV
ncbi:hypothetical protein HanPI659440_Chr12g0448171 [Helianthus annuus]|nr:hypothetical protein HanPI659440_Chr12g0448171 [Helianthus annuus]